MLAGQVIVKMVVAGRTAKNTRFFLLGTALASLQDGNSVDVAAVSSPLQPFRDREALRASHRIVLKRQDGGRGLGHPGGIVQLRLGGADRP